MSVVIGIGNPLRADDGLGHHVVEALRREMPEVEAVDASTYDIEIIEHLRGRSRAVIVDALLTGAEPGTIHRLRPEEIGETGFRRTHGPNLPSVLRLASQLYSDELPGEITIIGVEAEDVESFSWKLTPMVRSALPRVIEEIRRALSEDSPQA